MGLARAELLGKRLWEIGAFRDVVANQAAFQKLQTDEHILNARHSE